MTAGVPDIRTSCFRPWRSMPAWNRGMRALEVGIGTGQATRPFLEAGCRVTAVELGEKLAAYSQVKFQNFFNLEILQGDFMKCPLQGDSFDLLYSATAFHWIPEEQGYPKALRLLKSGGTLAVWWNHPCPAPGTAGAVPGNSESVWEVRPRCQEISSGVYGRKLCAARPAAERNGIFGSGIPAFSQQPFLGAGGILRTAEYLFGSSGDGGERQSRFDGGDFLGNHALWRQAGAP